MIKYRASTHFDRIDRYDVAEDEDYKEDKPSSSHAWFDTWQEAHDYLKARILEEVKKVEAKLDRLSEKRTMIYEMKEPTDA